MTDENARLVLYDAHCAFCARWAQRLGPTLQRRGFELKPLPEPSDEMRVHTRDGTVVGGADAVVYLARKIWWAWPVVALSKLPGGMALLRRGYRWVASNRYCSASACAQRRGRDRDVAPPTTLGGLLFPIGALLFRDRLPAWAFMWVMLAALFLGFKWMMWRRGLPWPVRWAGGAPGQRVRAVALKIALGAGLFWGVARWLPGELARGWAGMIGLALMLHFGVAQWLSPLMRAPLRARSVAEFWGRRWNVAFPQVARPLIFEPARRRLGPVRAITAVFGVSGLLHELVISVPASAGYGLPTLYFLVQAAGVCVERRIRRCRRLFAWVVVAGPVFWLFHPPFVRNVMLPMMEAWGAL